MVGASGGRVFAARAELGPRDAPVEGKSGVYLPRVAGARAARELEPLRHEAEVMSLAACSSGPGEHWVAAADAAGRATVARFRGAGLWGADAADDDAAGGPGPAPEPCGLYTLGPAAFGERGWTGVALHAANPAWAVVARFFAKDATVYDGDFPVCTFRSDFRPKAVLFVPPEAFGGATTPVVALAGGAKLAFWDPRAGGGAAAKAVKRLDCPDDLGVLGWAPPVPGLYGQGVVAAAGAERCVNVWDPRRLGQVVTRWASAARHPITALAFSSRRPLFCFVGSTDGDVRCGAWDLELRKRLQAEAGERPGEGEGGAPGPTGTQATPAPRGQPGGFHFRGPARWVGLAKADGADVLAGVTASHALVAAAAG